jgi:hypothetical protein
MQDAHVKDRGKRVLAQTWLDRRNCDCRRRADISKEKLLKFVVKERDPAALVQGRRYCGSCVGAHLETCVEGLGIIYCL